MQLHICGCAQVSFCLCTSSQSCILIRVCIILLFPSLLHCTYGYLRANVVVRSQISQSHPCISLWFYNTIKAQLSLHVWFVLFCRNCVPSTQFSWCLTCSLVDDLCVADARTGKLLLPSRLEFPTAWYLKLVNAHLMEQFLPLPNNLCNTCRFLARKIFAHNNPYLLWVISGSLRRQLCSFEWISRYSCERCWRIY